MTHVNSDIAHAQVLELAQRHKVLTVKAVRLNVPGCETPYRARIALNDLVTYGLLEAHKEGRVCRYRLTERGDYARRGFVSPNGWCLIEYDLGISIRAVNA